MAPPQSAYRVSVTGVPTSLVYLSLLLGCRWLSLQSQPPRQCHFSCPLAALLPGAVGRRPFVVDRSGVADRMTSEPSGRRLRPHAPAPHNAAWLGRRSSAALMDGFCTPEWLRRVRQARPDSHVLIGSGPPATGHHGLRYRTYEGCLWARLEDD